MENWNESSALQSHSSEDMNDMSRQNAYVLRPIGVVRSILVELRDAPRQPFEGAPEALLEIYSRFSEALHRVRPGMELILLTWLHRADRDVLQVHPMGVESIPLTGVFATRSPDRPNPIGLHQVTVIGIEQSTMLRVQALEAIDGTPILDLKAVRTALPGGPSTSRAIRRAPWLAQFCSSGALLRVNSRHIAGRRIKRGGLWGLDGRYPRNMRSQRLRREGRPAVGGRHGTTGNERVCISAKYAARLVPRH